jgi:glycosyltransferase involved in cell wall biosynthesis
MNKKLSIALCTYNGALFIKEQIFSLLEQTYPIWEIVIVDDGSKDNTLSIIDEIVKNSKIKIRVYQNEDNLGYNKNFEKACKLAEGDLISICDQDDIWEKDKLQLLIENWNSNTLLTYCDSILFYNNEIPQNPNLGSLTKRIEGKNPKQIAVFNTISGHNIIFRKELLKLATPFPKDVYYDWWLSMVAMVNGGISHLPMILVYQRVHTKNVTINIGDETPKKDKHYGTKKNLSKQLSSFVSIPNLSKKDYRFFNDFSYLWNAERNSINTIKLFWFFVKNAKDIFSYKVRKFPWLSYIKHSYRIVK